MTMGEKLSLLRKKMKMTQDELAETLGVSRQSVSRWEVDVAFPETDKLIKLSKLFNCSIDFLLNESMEECFAYRESQHKVMIRECYKFIRECGYFFLATSVDNQPKLRPMGMIYGNEKALYFATDKRKNVYTELMKNSCIEIASYNLNSRKWVRITGKVQIASATQIVEEMKEVYPMIKQEYEQEEEDLLVIFKILPEEIKIL